MKGMRWRTGESLMMVSMTPWRRMSLESFAASARVRAMGVSFRVAAGLGPCPTGGLWTVARGRLIDFRFEIGAVDCFFVMCGGGGGGGYPGRWSLRGRAGGCLRAGGGG